MLHRRVFYSGMERRRPVILISQTAMASCTLTKCIYKAGNNVVNSRRIILLLFDHESPLNILNDQASSGSTDLHEIRFEFVY